MVGVSVPTPTAFNSKRQRIGTLHNVLAQTGVPSSSSPRVTNTTLSQSLRLGRVQAPSARVLELDQRERSAALCNDHKMLDIRHFVRSHSHEDRLKSAVMDPVDPSVVRKWGVDDKKEEWSRDLRSRLEWRSNFDRILRRLIIDTELDVEATFDPEARDSLRCKHLDDSFKLYEAHGAKEVKKEREALPFVYFKESDPVMPGSLRREGRARHVVTPSSRAHWLPPALAHIHRRSGPSSMEATSDGYRGSPLAPLLRSAGGLPLTPSSVTPRSRRACTTLPVSVCRA